MHHLLLLRHAKSSWDDPSLSDHARPLNARGRRAAALMAQLIREWGLAPDTVLVSSARRTLQTLEALAPLPGAPRVEPLDELYLASWDRLLDTLRDVPESTGTLLMIGHNPGLHDLALALLGEAAARPESERVVDGFPTGALAEFTVDGSWRTLQRGGARLLRFTTPKDVPEATA